MNGGHIKCNICGQDQYIETIKNYFNCIKCGTKHEALPIPEEDDEEIIE